MISRPFTSGNLTNLEQYQKTGEQDKISDIRIARKKDSRKQVITCTIMISDEGVLNKIRSRDHFINIKNISDEKPDSICLFVYTFTMSNHDYPSMISIFYDKNERRVESDKIKYNFTHLIDVEIEKFDERGLIFLKSANVNTSILSHDDVRKMLNQTFIDLRDLYHDHYHHFISDLELAADDMNKPWINDSDENHEDLKELETKAVYYVLDFYRTRLVYYLKYNNKIISSFYKTPRAFEVSILLRRQTKGCIIYALNFMKFYKEEINQFQYNFFEIAFQSGNDVIDTFSEQINTTISLEIENKLDKVLVILGQQEGNGSGRSQRFRNPRVIRRRKI